MIQVPPDIFDVPHWKKPWMVWCILWQGHIMNRIRLLRKRPVRCPFHARSLHYWECEDKKKPCINCGGMHQCDLILCARCTGKTELDIPSQQRVRH